MPEGPEAPTDQASALSTPTYVVLMLLSAVVLYLLGLVIRGVTAWTKRVLRRTRPPQRPRTQPPPSQQQPGPVLQPTPGVSMKTLVKRAKSSARSQPAGEDRATQHPLYINTLKGHGDVVDGLAISPDGSALATACEDRIVRVFKLEDLASKSMTFKRHTMTATPMDVAFGGSATHVAVTMQGAINTARLCMLAPASNGKVGSALEVEWEVTKSHGSKPAVQLHAGAGRTLLSVSDKTELRLFSCEQGKELALVDAAGLRISMAAMSQDGRFFGAATFTPDVKVWEVKSDRSGVFQSVRKVMDLTGHSREVRCLAFSPSARRAVTFSTDGTWQLHRIDVRYEVGEDAKSMARHQQQAAYTHAVMLDDARVAAACEQRVDFLNASSGVCLGRIEAAHSHPIRYLQFAAAAGSAGQPVLVTAAHKQVRLWQTTV